LSGIAPAADQVLLHAPPMDSVSSAVQSLQLPPAPGTSPTSPPSSFFPIQPPARAPPTADTVAVTDVSSSSALDSDKTSV
jgi:hypothetical protein